MKYPRINAPNVGRTYVQKFYGYNNTPSCTEAEFSDMKNLTSDSFPAISPRARRKKGDEYSNPKGMIGKGYDVAIASGTGIYYEGEFIDLGLNPNTDKQMVSMGAYICIFPDKVKYNTYDGTISQMECTYKNVDGKTVKFGKSQYKTPSFTDVSYSMYTSGKPSNPKNGDMYMLATTNESTDYTYNVTLQQYYSDSAAWFPVDLYQTLVLTNNVKFVKGDFITLSGFKTVEYLDPSTMIPHELYAEGMNGTYEIQEVEKVNPHLVGEDMVYDTRIAIVCPAMESILYQIANMSESTLTTFFNMAISNSVEVSRKVPDMDYVCEFNNRLWGCSSANHEIYASKLGDPNTWYDYSGLASDSYAVTVGSDGDFTGCSKYNNSVLFFKENLVHKVLGTSPSNYQLNTTYTYGVQKGSEDSICIINEVLYFKSEYAVCYYDGSVAEIISNSFGSTHYKDASASGYNNKYYISMRDDNNKPYLFVYDLTKGIWHKEDNLDVYAFSTLSDGTMAMLECNGQLWWVGKGSDEDNYSWEFITGKVGLDSPDHKYLSRFDLRMFLSVGEELNVFIEYDSSGIWEHKGTIRNVGSNSVVLPIVPKRCDHMRIKCTGLEEETKIYSIAKIYEQGSDG